MSSSSRWIMWFGLALLAQISSSTAATPFHNNKRGTQEHRALLSLSRRQLSRYTKTYIGVVVGILGTIVLISAWVCWDLLRRRRLSRMREMEEARHPRVPISYDHFPVEDGDAEGLQHHGQDVAPSRQPLTTGADLSSRSSPSHHHVGSLPLASSTIPPATTTLTYPQPVYAYRHHRPTRSQSSSANSSVNGETAPLASQGDIPRYEDNEDPILPPPPAFYSDSINPVTTIRLPPPPGLEDVQRPTDGRQEVSSVPSRPPTASAPPAYTPST